MAARGGTVRAGEWVAADAHGVVMGTGQLPSALLALAGSGLYAIAVVTQQGAAARLPSDRVFDLAVVVRLARRPVWLAGLAAVIAGLTLQFAALGLGRLVVIEPLFASYLLFALVLAARRDRRPLRPAEWAAAVAVIAGLAVFLAAGRPAGGERTASAAPLALAAAVAAVIGLGGVLAGWLAPRGRGLLFGLGGGVAAGATDALVKTVAVLAVGHLPHLLGDLRLYLVLGMGLLTYTIQQNGYRAAGLAGFLPAFAVMEPVSGSLLGLLVYHERLSDGPGQIAVELAACAFAIWGIARLARSGTAAGPGAGPDLPAPAGPAVTVGRPGPDGLVATCSSDDT